MSLHLMPLSFISKAHANYLCTPVRKNIKIINIFANKRDLAITTKSGRPILDRFPLYVRGWDIKIGPKKLP